MDTLIKIIGEIQCWFACIRAEGGMNTIYGAKHLWCDKFTKTVDIKIILKEFSKIPEFRSNFIGDTKLVVDLIHTNIVQTYTLGIHDTICYMITKYVNGITLKDFLSRHLGTKVPMLVDLSIFIVSRIYRKLA